MSAKPILIMAGGTGGHIFSSGVTRAMRALACTENVPYCASSQRGRHG